MARRGGATGAAGATRPVRAPRVRPSRASSPSLRPNLASAGVGRPPGGGGGGVPKVTTSMASMPRAVINKPKTGRPGRGLNLRPRADFPSRI